MEMHGSGVRDISHVLSIGINTVIWTLKKIHHRK
ncbi:IS1-like element transposase [Xenorhabdus sp. KJ12.1]